MIQNSKSLLSRIRSNRKALRLRGLTGCDVLTLESLASKGEGFQRIGYADLGRMTGVSRSVARRHVLRLEAVGAVIRMGSAMMVNVRSVLSWCEGACRQRALAVKALYLKRQSKLVSTLLPHRGQKDKSAPLGAELAVLVPDRAAALADLRSLYVPLHLRASRT